MNSKQIWRQKLLLRRKSIDAGSASALSKKIADIFFNKIPVDEAQSVHIYKSLRGQKEVLTNPIAARIKEQYPQIKLVYAPINASRQADRQDQARYDIVVVPVVGFDQAGHRLGYGKGYYDKFLRDADYRISVGLAYSFCEIKPRIENESHDIKVDYIITEKQLINCRHKL